MSSKPQPADIELTRCPGCGREVVGTIPRCVHCKMELQMDVLVPEVEDPRKKSGVEVCALCGERYDTLVNDSCPRCAERFASTGQRALDDHLRRRARLEFVPRVAGIGALVFLGWLANFGATRLIATFSSGLGLWLVAGIGALLTGAMAVLRFRDEASWPRTLAAACGVAIGSAAWLHAALIWANGLSAAEPPRLVECEVLEVAFEAVTLSCAVDGQAQVGVHRDLPEGEAPEAGGRGSYWLREGRLGFWVASPPPEASEPED